MYGISGLLVRNAVLVTSDCERLIKVLVFSCGMKIVHKVAAICVQRNKLLLVQKAKKGVWTTPGGKMEEGESEEGCLSREVKEELDCDVKVIRFLGSWERKKEGKLFRLSAYLVELSGVMRIADAELVEFKFVGKASFVPISEAWRVRGKVVPLLVLDSLMPRLFEEKVLEW